jgi:hypothetical protein
MSNRFFSVCLFLGLLSVSPTWTMAQESEPHIRVEVNMVQLNVAVTDAKGNYVTGLRPRNFVITEDGIPEKLATFGEGNEPVRKVTDAELPDARPVPQDSTGSPAPTADGTLGTLVWRQRLHFVRHQQLHVPRLRLRPGRDRRFRPFPGIRR